MCVVEGAYRTPTCDAQTDRQTDTGHDGIYHASIASRDRNLLCSHENGECLYAYITRT